MVDPISTYISTYLQHRAFWDAGHRVFGLHGQKVDGSCKCGDPDCKAILKHPLVSGWQHTPIWDDGQIEVMEESGQFDTGFGVLLRGLLVVDVDARNGGLESFEKLLETVPEVAGAGLIVNTGSGGGSRHLYFKVPPGVALVTKHPDYPGIDFKSGAAYVVGPGSLHASGRRYEVAVGTPDDIDDAPEALIKLLTKPEPNQAELGDRKVDVSHADLADMLRHIDGYDDYEKWVRVGMALHHASNGTAIELWDQWSSHSDKYMVSEIAAKWQSFGKGANPVTLGTLTHYAEEGGWKRPVTFTPDVEFDISDADIEKWPMPEMRFLGNRGVPAPDLSLEDIIDRPMAEAVRHIAHAKGAPVDYVFVALLTTVATLMSGAFVASPASGWTEPAILWAMLIGEPSAGKSPALDGILSLLRRIQKDLQQREQKEVDSWIEKEKVAKVVEKKWLKDVAESIKQGTDAPARPQSVEIGTKPNLTRIIVTDTTIEALAVIASEQTSGILTARDELAGWLASMTRYTRDGGDRAFWLEAYGGRSFGNDRMTRSVQIDRLSISVVGGIQPDRMHNLLMQADDDGLLARMIPIWPNPVPIENLIDHYDDGQVDRLLRTVHSVTEGIAYNGRPEPFVLQFEADARETLQQLRKLLRAKENEAEGLMKSFLGKVVGLTVRVALVLAFVNSISRGTGTPHSISGRDFEQAKTFTVDYVIPMAERAYEAASVSKTERAARQILWLAKQNHWEKLRVRDIKRRGRNGLTDDKDILAALSMLIAADWIKEDVFQPTQKGGRPTTTYHVNPKLWEV